MKEINEIYLGRLNNGAHFQYMTNILNRVTADVTLAKEEHLAPLVETLMSAVYDEDKNLVLSRKSLYTDEIKAADDRRDALYSAYKRGVSSYVDFPDTDLAEAAKVLSQHIKDYGIDPAMQLDKETGLLSNFTADLQAELAGHVAKLSLTAFVEKLAAANAEVISYTLKRTEERMGVETGALKTARAASDNAYRALVKMVNALALVFGDADYADFIDYVNTEIAHYKQEVINGRSASSKEEAEAE